MELENLNPEHMDLHIETQEKLVYHPDSVEAVLDVLFKHLAMTADKRHNLVFTQLIESQPNPLEAIKGGSWAVSNNNRKLFCYF